MRLIILLLTIIIALSTAGQNDTAFPQRLQRVLLEYPNNFKRFIGNQKLFGVPKRLFIEPGLQGGIDELHIWDDTLFIYSCVILERSDSFSTRQKVTQLDDQLKTILGSQFNREADTLSFSGPQEVPLTFQSETIQVSVIVGKYKNYEYMTLLGIKGHALKRKKVH
jgi:hypothetical protein